MRERERAGGEFNHRLPSGDRCKVCVCLCVLGCSVFVCVLEEAIEKESVQYSVAHWETPLQSVCLSLFVRQNKWEERRGEKGKESDSDTVSVCVCVYSTLHQHLLI